MDRHGERAHRHHGTATDDRREDPDVIPLSRTHPEHPISWSLAGHSPIRPRTAATGQRADNSSERAKSVDILERRCELATAPWTGRTPPSAASDAVCTRRIRRIVRLKAALSHEACRSGSASASCHCAEPGQLFINAEPGAIVHGRIRDLIRSWPNLTETTISGVHFVQEDTPDEIGTAVAQFVRTLRSP